MVVKKIIFAFILFCIPFSFSRAIEYYDSSIISVENQISIDVLHIDSDSLLTNLTYSAYLAPQKGGMYNISCKDCKVVYEEQKYISGVFLGDTNRVESVFHSDVIINREINRIEKIPNYPYLNGFSDKIKNYLEYTNLSNYDINICQKTSEIIQGSSNYLEVIMKISSFVSEYIDYDTNYGNKGYTASQIFDLKKGVCGDFAVLLISMLRCSGIPARYAGGYAYSNLINDFGPHAWAEVYVPEYGWISVDSTYGQSGWLDSEHIKFDDANDSSNSKTMFFYYYGEGELSLDSSIITKAETTNKTLQKKEISASINFNTNEIKPESYFLMWIEFDEADAYIPISSAELSTTSSMDVISKNNADDYVILSPEKKIKKYYIIKMDDVEIEENYYQTHSFSFYMPLLGNISGEINVSNDGEYFSLLDVRDLIEFETTEISSLKSDITIENVTYENKILSLVELQNTGNMIVPEAEILLEIDGNKIKKIERDILVSETRKVTIENETSLGAHNVSIIVKYGSNLIQKNFLVNAVSKPEIYFVYDYLKEAKEGEKINITLNITNKNKTNLTKLEVVFNENVLTFYPETDNLEIILESPQLSSENNKFNLKIDYFDDYLKKSTEEEIIEVYAKSEDILSIIINLIKELLNRISSLF